MKLLIGKYIITLVIIGWATGLWSAELAVSLENPPEEGTVIILLFDSANTFGDLRDPVRTESFTLDGRETYRLENVPPGEYAMLVVYDENRNAQVDKNFIGIPREPVGFSNAYQPKGPPSFSRAAFVLVEGETQRFDVELRRSLGERGRFGVGLGVIGRSSPYRGYDGSVIQFIPALTYTGNRFQIYGPTARFGLWGSGKVRLAATAQYRMGVYEENDSDYLSGMGDRKGTLMAGAAVSGDLPGGLGLTLGYSHDLLDKIGGGEARLELDKSFQFGRVRLTPGVALNWLSADLSNHDFGVPLESARPGRPAYDPGDTFSTEVGVGMFIEITRDWLILLNLAAEFLESEVRDSPIVEDRYVIKGFAAVNYVF